MSENVIIFFDNGMKAKFPMEKVLFMSPKEIDRVAYQADGDEPGRTVEELLVEDDMAIVNWDNVCFVRKELKKDEED